jgi:hypothetical protein
VKPTQVVCQQIIPVLFLYTSLCGKHVDFRKCFYIFLQVFFICLFQQGKFANVASFLIFNVDFLKRKKTGNNFSTCVA